MVVQACLGYHKCPCVAWDYSVRSSLDRLAKNANVLVLEGISSSKDYMRIKAVEL